MLLPKFLVLAVLGVIPIAIACGRSDAPPIETSTSPTTSPSINTASADRVLPGEYCYQTNEETLSAVLRLTVAEDQTVSGESRATIQNDAEGYYSSYAQDISGTVSGDRLTAQISTTIENDVQETEETWSITPDEVVTSQTQLSAVDCGEVESSFTE